MRNPNVIILRTAGTNCDTETAFAFELAGAQVELIHINQLLNKQKNLSDYQILAIPGGFTYGDDIAAGKILANELKYKFGDEIKKFIVAGNLIIGICNGFQVLVKMGLLPGNTELKQEATLTINDLARFEDRWVYLKRGMKKCIWTENLPEIIYLPVAHGEGKFITKDNAVLERIKKNGQIVFQYCDSKGNFWGFPFNPNGSIENIAGITDETGRVFGLMPHPERYIQNTQHPFWANIGNNKKEGDGLVIFRNAVNYAKSL